MLTPLGWRDYELIDTGDYQKLERWGQYVASRPEPRVVWKKNNPDIWKSADAVFENDQWNFKTELPQSWVINYGLLKFKLKATSFKHTGLFPEQAVNWDWIAEKLKNSKTQNIKVLNLFAYTGGATLAAAVKGAHVTHVDSSKPAMMWASENAQLSNISKDKIRWIQEDAEKFVQREIRRGAKYDAIIMDPPRFGRGPGGEVWKLEENLPRFVWDCKQILSEEPKFFLINAYTADLSAVALKNLLEDALEKEVESGEIGLKQSCGTREMPAGVFARWNC